MTVIVPAGPTANFTWAPEPACLGAATGFFGASGDTITSWHYDFGDGNFANVQNPSHTYGPGQLPGTDGHR